MKRMYTHLTLAAGLVAAAFTLQAQTPSFSAHYPAGSEGIKAASLPPPGVYLRDYNYFYFADQFPGGPRKFNLLAYVQAPRLIWISKCKLLGGYYGADIFVPFGYTDIMAGGPSDSKFGLTDIFIEPITLSWHGKQFDAAVGYGLWAPTGDFDKIRMANPGKGYWGHMFTAGATWYPDKDKTWSISALNRYEINHEHNDLDITPGQAWTLEFGIGKNLHKTTDIGLIGYYQLQTTADSGRGSSNAKDHVVGLGPEINMFCPKFGFFTSLRYAREFAALNRPEGNVISLTLTKPF